MKHFITLILLVVFFLLSAIGFADSGPAKVEPKFAPSYSVATDGTLTTTVSTVDFKVQGTTPPPSINYEAVYDFKDHKGYAVVTRSVGQLTHVLGTKLSLDAFGFVGADTSGAPVTGVGAKARIPLAAELDFYAGAGVRVLQGAPIGAVVFVGLSFRFNQTPVAP